MIIYLNGHLALWGKNGDGTLHELETVKTPALEKEYNLIKSIAHCSVWLNLILQSVIENKKKHTYHMQDLLSMELSLRELREQKDEQVQKKHAVLDTLLKMIVSAKSVDSTERLQCLQAQLLQEMKEVNEGYCAQATKLQVNGLHQIVNQWNAKERIQLEHTRFIIVTPQGPREDLIEKQYAIDLFLKQGIEIKKETDYVLCVEMLPEQMATVTQSSLIVFLKKNQVNREVGHHMLGDSNAMKRDILGAYAPPVLKKLCPLGF